MISVIANLIGIAVTWGVWLWLAGRPFSPTYSALIAILGSLALIPIVYGGRWLLDRQPTISQAVAVTTLIHYLIAILLGAAVIEAVHFAQNSESWPIPLPPWLGLTIMAFASTALVLVVFNLALKGMGAPFAVALTRVVATDWMYSWTRNPMVLSAWAFLIGLGLWLQSSLFILWIMIFFSPAALIFLRVYEERELEIRFGDAYLTYKNKTPMFWPRRPKHD